MKTVAGRKLRMFRCHIAPLIGPKVLQAHVPKDLNWDAEYTAQENVLVKTKDGVEFVIHGSNIIMAELYPKYEEDHATPIRKLGRPAKEQSGTV